MKEFVLWTVFLFSRVTDAATGQDTGEAEVSKTLRHASSQIGQCCCLEEILSLEEKAGSSR